MSKKYMKRIDECGMYYYICNEKEIIAEGFYGDDAQDVVDLLNEQEERIQNQKEYILLLEQKLEENGIRLEPKDFD